MAHQQFLGLLAAFDLVFEKGIDLAGVSGTAVTNLTWDTIKRLRDTVKVKLVLKGILAFEDAKLAADAGIAKFFDAKALAHTFDLSRQLRYVDAIFRRVFTQKSSAAV